MPVKGGGPGQEPGAGLGPLGEAASGARGGPRSAARVASAGEEPDFEPDFEGHRSRLFWWWRIRDCETPG